MQTHPMIFSFTDALLQAATFNYKPSLTILTMIDKARVFLTDDNDVAIPHMKHVLRSAFVGNDHHHDADSNGRYVTLMHVALFSNAGHLWLHDLETSSFFTTSDTTGRRAWRLKIWQPSALQYDNYITAYHGSPTCNWFFIIQCGMRSESIDFSSNGRAYGNDVDDEGKMRTPIMNG